MNKNDDDILGLLRKEAATFTERGLQRDLWPEMRKKLHESGVRVPWIDWALIIIAIALCIFFPETALGVLYHL